MLSADARLVAWIDGLCAYYIDTEHPEPQGFHAAFAVWRKTLFGEVAVDMAELLVAAMEEGAEAEKMLWEASEIAQALLTLEHTFQDEQTEQEFVLDLADTFDLNAPDAHQAESPNSNM